jgi:hypothetical protein
MSEDKKTVAESKLSLSEEKNLGFLELMAKTNIEKITREILEGIQFLENQLLNRVILII